MVKYTSASKRSVVFPFGFKIVDFLVLCVYALVVLVWIMIEMFFLEDSHFVVTHRLCHHKELIYKSLDLRNRWFLNDDSWWKIVCHLILKLVCLWSPHFKNENVNKKSWMCRGQMAFILYYKIKSISHFQKLEFYQLCEVDHMNYLHQTPQELNNQT